MSVSEMKILVTGASSGIGAHITRFLAKEGATVVAAARREAQLAALAEDCAGAVIPLAMDVGDPASVETGVAKAAEQMGGLDGLFNNAGIAWGGRAMEMSEDDWSRVIDINVNGVFRAAKAAAHVMARDGGGAILNTASILGFGTGSGSAAYATSKAAVVHATRCLALEWARHDIRVNAIAPGYFLTEMTDPFLSSEHGKDLAKDVPMRRIGNLHELEGPVELLLGSKGTFITGATLAVDGGHLCRSL
ncbi:MAG: SDR family oxidoreductase [Pseudomonadota bacterium]